MARVALVLAGIAHAGHGWREPTSIEPVGCNLSPRRETTAHRHSPSRTLTSFLLALHPAAAFTIPSPGSRPLVRDAQNRRGRRSFDIGTSTLPQLYGTFRPQKVGRLLGQPLAQVQESEEESSQDALIVGGALAFLLAIFGIDTALQANGMPSDDSHKLLLILIGVVSFVGYIIASGGELNIDASGQWAVTEARLQGPPSRGPPLLAIPNVTTAAETFRKTGVVRLDGVITKEMADTARAAVDRQLQVAKAADAAGKKGFLGGVLRRENRYDVLLDPCDDATPELASTMQAALNGPLGEVLSELGLESDAPLHEMSALVADPGAPRQPIHPDTPFQDRAPLYTVFIALQDVDASMGPTLFLPGSCRKDAHDAFNQGDIMRSRLVGKWPFAVSLLKAGDIALFDSRILHAGAGNDSDRRRVMLYFTVADKRASRPVAPGSIRPTAGGRHTLGNLKTGQFKKEKSVEEYKKEQAMKTK